MNYSRYNPPCKTMPIEYVESLYAIVDIQAPPVTKDIESAHMKSKVHRLTQLEGELVAAERKLARAFSQSEFNQAEDLIDTLQSKISKLQQELTSTRPEWMIKALRKAA